ncbi:MAG: hypothetical protein ACJ763_00045 [Bdellovibrionia bacterium]
MQKLMTFLILMAAACGCSHAPTTNTPSNSNAQDWAQATVEIHYVLRHSDRRLTLESDAQGVHGKSLVDGTQLKQCQVDAVHYQEFVSKVRNFISQRRSLASADCRAPYTITLKNQKDTLQIQGCRTQDEGAFSHLVQEGEFLIYRQK